MSNVRFAAESLPKDTFLCLTAPIKICHTYIDGGKKHSYLNSSISGSRPCSLTWLYIFDLSHDHQMAAAQPDKGRTSTHPIIYGPLIPLKIAKISQQLCGTNKLSHRSEGQRIQLQTSSVLSHTCFPSTLDHISPHSSRFATNMTALHLQPADLSWCTETRSVVLSHRIYPLTLEMDCNIGIRPGNMVWEAVWQVTNSHPARKR